MALDAEHGRGSISTISGNVSDASPAAASQLIFNPFAYPEATPSRYVQVLLFPLTANDCATSSASRIELYPLWDSCTFINSNVSTKAMYIQSTYTAGTSIVHQLCSNAQCSADCVSKTLTPTVSNALLSGCAPAVDGTKMAKVMGVFGLSASSGQQDSSKFSLSMPLIIALSVGGVFIVAVIVFMGFCCRAMMSKQTSPARPKRIEAAAAVI
eukprot:jgi/Hompol1/3521/HPOL_003267-RA